MQVAVRARRDIQELRGLYGDLHRFGKDLRDATLRFQEMVRTGSFQEHGRSCSYASDDPEDILNRSIDITREFEFLVAVTGAFSSGKSTLLNLLLDRPDLLPAAVIPMTAVCTVIRHGDEPRARVRYVPPGQCYERVRAFIPCPFKQPFTGPEHLAEALEHPERFLDDEPAQLSLQRFAGLLRRYDELLAAQVTFGGRAPFIAGGGILPAEGGGSRYFSPTPNEEKEYLQRGGDPRGWVTKEWLALIRDVSLWVPSPLLENDIVFLDLPGLNCREDYHRRAIREYCNMADCIVVTAFQPGNQADEEVIANFKKLSLNYRDKIFFVFNKVDQFAQEPDELVRAVDYLGRDTIGSDFPQERFFLTSAQLARAQRTGASSWRAEQERLAAVLAPLAGGLPGLDGWVQRVTDPDDPGGVGHLKESVYRFLLDDAYRTKVAEIVQNYRAVLDGLAESASPTLEQALKMDATDILRKTVLDYFRHVEKLWRKAVYHFRFDYLRGHEDGGDSVLREDLNRVLDDVHRQVQDRVRAYFDRPILSAPLREDPVSEFDLLIIADEASRNLRRELQDVVINPVHDQVCRVLEDCLRQGEIKAHLGNLFRRAPDAIRQVETLLGRFEQTMLHSLKCIVRNGLFHMPRGRELKRLGRAVPLAQMKERLIEVFCDFYPAWIYENIYGEVIERLSLSLFLDGEDLEEELAAFFRSTEGLVTGAHVAEKVEIPEKLADGSRHLYQSIRMCQEIDGLRERCGALGGLAASIGAVAVAVAVTA